MLPMNSLNLNLIRGDTSINLIIAVSALVLVGLACRGSVKPAPTEYVGFWIGADGATINIRADGTGDYKSGGAVNTSVSGGTVDIKDAEKTMSIKLLGMGPTFKIDEPPSGDQMTLSGIVYKKGGVAAALEMPTEPELQELVKATIMDFNDAVQSGDFSNFYKKAAKKWQEQSTAGEMKEAFKVFIDNKESFDLKSLSRMKATFEPSPTFEPLVDEKALSLTGSYPTTPKKLRFELKYLKDDGFWKVASIRVRTTDQ
jgi:hypothetical protein